MKDGLLLSMFLIVLYIFKYLNKNKGKLIEANNGSSYYV